MIIRRTTSRYSIAIQTLWFSTPSTSHSVNNEVNTPVRQNVTHVKSVNILTGAKSTVELIASNHKIRKFRREFCLPKDAISGLRDALISCERTPRQLQSEADQLSEMLMQRRFPAPSSVVQKVRNQVKKMLRENDQQYDVYNLMSEELKASGTDHRLRHEVDKILKKAHFNWRPLAIETKEAAAAYALSRLVPNYAEISRVLEEFDDAFCPQTVLDYGCGVCSGFWAFNERYGSAVKEYCMVDLSVAITDFAMDIMRVDNGNLLHRNIHFRRNLTSSFATQYDVVIAHRTLCEIGSTESRLDLVASLWRRTKRFLILIDSGVYDAFDALMEARDFLLLSGTRLHLEDTISLLEERNLMTDNINGILHNKDISDYERYFMISDLVPAEVTLPTALHPAKIYAPCPHDLGCPKLTTKSPCTFPVRWRVIRADGKHSSREISGTEVGKFSFVILEKGIRGAEEALPRILQVRKSGGHATCNLCTSFDGIQSITVSRRARTTYQRIRARKDGEVFPLHIKRLDGLTNFDLAYEKSKSS